MYKTELVYCVCGCGLLRSRIDSQDRVRRFIHWHSKNALGHQFKASEETKRRMSKSQIGRKLSEETRRKISEQHKGENNHNYGNHLSNKIKRKISLSLMGIIRSKETRNKISIGKKGKRISEATRKKMIGRQLTKETRNKISLFNIGKKLSEETKRKISESHKGEKSYLWKGGISFEPYGLAWTEQLKNGVRERDNYVCQLCDKHQSQLKTKLNVHHIDYIKINTFTFNLISLCTSCHMMTNNNRNHWTTFFRNYLSEKYGYIYHTKQKLLNEVYN